MSTQKPRKSPSGTSKGSQASGGQTCAECRRLKIRCDRKVPCEQCKRRGCASICPEGQLVPAHGNGNNRITGQVPNNIDAIYRKLESFSQRIKELEEALQETHARVSTDTHPLLAPDLVRLTKEDEEMVTDDSSTGEGSGEEMIALAFGSLINGPGGTTRYLGPSAASSWLFPTEAASGPTFDELPSSVSFHNVSPATAVQLRAQIESHIPSKEIIRSLVTSYFKYSLSLFQPLTPSGLTRDCVAPPIDQLSPPQLALLCMVLALAAQLDPNPAPHWHSSTTYYALSRAALALEDIHTNTAIETVETIGLQSVFLLRSSHNSVPERAWASLGLAMRCAQAMGLHRDPKRWGVADDLVQRRRRTFYELWTFDILLSACLGRPPSLNRHQVDCEMPLDDAVSLGQNPAFYRWKHQRWATIVLEVTVSALSSLQPPSYSTIISLDKQLRSSPLPDKLSGAADPCRVVDRALYPQISVRWQEHAVHLHNTYTLLVLHRPFFARALLESPEDIFKHRFLRSVMTVHDSAKSIINHFIWVSKNEPESLRAILFWRLTILCSLVSLGALIIKAPNSTLATNCLPDLDQGCKQFASLQSSPSSTTVMLEKLLRSAHLAMSSTSGAQSASSPPILVEPASFGPVTVSPSMSVPSSAHHSPNSSINLSVPYAPSSAASNPPSPRLTVMVEGNDGRAAGPSPVQWDFADYMRVHSNAQNYTTPAATATPKRSPSGITVPSVPPLYIVPSSHADPHMSAVTSPYGGGHMDSVYASPYPVSPPTGSGSGSYHASEYHHRHQTTSPTTGELGNVSWEHFMSSMGL